MCTNRLSALDPAVRRRAADILLFSWPDDAQRIAVLEPLLKQMGFSDQQLQKMVQATGAREDCYGFTFSDLTQRLLPAVVLDAYPSKPVNPDRALEIALEMTATVPFQEQES